MRLATSFLVLLFLLSVHPGHSQEKAYPNVTIRNTEVRKIKSEYVENMEYHIHVSLPANYRESDQSYPVAYYTDAFFWGGIVIETYRLLRAFNEIPPLILVGISYDNNEQNGIALRARDFTPTYVATETLPEWLKPFTPASGGAAQFLSFVEDELIPFVESNYRVDSSERGMLGYSYGGLFSAYVLFKKPELFQKYFLGAPTLLWDDYYVFKEEEKIADKLNELPLKVFSAIGSDDFADLIKSWLTLRDDLNSRAYKNMSFEYLMIDGENHTSAVPAVYSRAFRVLYGRN